MSAGQRRRRLLLQQNTPTRDEYGGTLAVWSTTATVWGSVKALFGKEFQAVDQMNSDMNVMIRIEYDSSWATMDNSWRIKDKNSSKCYDVMTVALPEQQTIPGDEIVITALEGRTDDE